MFLTLKITQMMVFLLRILNVHVQIRMTLCGVCSSKFLLASLFIDSTYLQMLWCKVVCVMESCFFFLLDMDTFCNNGTKTQVHFVLPCSICRWMRLH